MNYVFMLFNFNIYLLAVIYLYILYINAREQVIFVKM